MFGSSKKINSSEQIPYSLYEALQEGSPRRGRWILEMLAAAVLTVLIAAVGVWLFRFIHSTKTPALTQSTNVTQSPQDAKSTTQSTSSPASTSAGKSNNNRNISQPTN